MASTRSVNQQSDTAEHWARYQLDQETLWEPYKLLVRIIHIGRAIDG